MLTAFQKRKLTKRFRLYDRENKGYIVWQDLERVLSEVAEINSGKWSESERETFLTQGKTGWLLLTGAADANHDNQIQLEEWLDFYEKVLEESAETPGQLPPWLEHMARLSFEAMDDNGDGVISIAEYGKLFQAYGIDQSELAPSFEKIDDNGDGVIQMEEWLQLNIDFYRGDDPKAASTWLWGDIYQQLFK